MKEIRAQNKVREKVVIREELVKLVFGSTTRAGIMKALPYI